MAQQLICLLGIVVALTGCAAQPDEILVARWRTGNLSRSELDRYILSLPEMGRIVDPSDPVVWWTDHARDAVLRELLRDAAGPAAQDRFDRVMRGELRRLVVEAELLKRYGPMIEPSEESLQQAWAKLESTFRTRESRQLFNIFRRADDPSSQRAALKELEALRQRILSGESFGSIAERYSDSESRHRRGLVGVFEPGQLDPRLDEIVFSLEPDIPSEPLTTHDGVHLFQVRAIFPAKSLSYEESRAEVIRHVQAEAAWERLDETAQELWTPGDGDLVLESEELARALRAVEDDPVLRIGDFAMSGSELMHWVRSNIEGPINAAKLAFGYRTLVRQEMILQTVEATSGIDEEILENLRSIEGRLWAESQLEIELQSIVTDGEIGTYFSTNAARFATPQRSHFKRLEVPLGDSAVAAMGRLEQARDAIDRGGLTFEELAGELGGRVDDLGWLTRPELAQILPSAPPSVFGLQQGEHGHPFSTGHSLVVLEVVANETPRAPKLDEVRAQVVARYVAEERPRLLKRVRETMLDDAGVEFDSAWLGSIGRDPGLNPSG